MKKILYAIEEYSVLFRARYPWRDIKYIIEEMDENILNEDCCPDTVFETEDKEQAMAYFKAREPKYIKVERQNNSKMMCATGAMLIEFEVEFDDEYGTEVARNSCGTPMYSVKPPMYHIIFAGGESRYSKDGVDYMMTLDAIEVDNDEDLSWEEGFLYNEVTIDDNDLDDDGHETFEAEDRHYNELRNDVITMAAKYGIEETQLIFYRD